MPRQAASTILLIRPASFSFNEQTAESNRFQKRSDDSDEIVKCKAVEEFDSLLSLLIKYNIDVRCLSDTVYPSTPDSIFPNNWVSFHEEGRIILYPMLAKNRRKESKKGFLQTLRDVFGYSVSLTLDLRYFESRDKFLEGTGSIVFDKVNRLAYVSLSERSHLDPLKEVCDFLKYKYILFESEDKDCFPVYHTNVVMSIGEDFAVISEESIVDKYKDIIMSSLHQHHSDVICISRHQMSNFCGNILQIRNQDDELYIIMSTTAYQSFTDRQLDTLNRHGNILVANIPTIESIGGGSTRCMIAEVF